MAEMTGVLGVRPGVVVLVPGAGEFIVRRFKTANEVLLEHLVTAERRVASLAEIQLPASAGSEDATAEVIDIAVVDETKWEAAKSKFDAVRSVASAGGGVAAVDAIAAVHGVHRATVYRWIDEYESRRLVTDLYRKPRSDVGRTRLRPRVEVIIRRVILDYHLTDERRKIVKSHREVERLCKFRGLDAPSLDTFKARLALCPDMQVAKLRGDVDRQNLLRLNRGSIQNADFPYALVQIDHTRVDIQLVDEEHRIAIGRPWITVAIDVYSRMCVGYYISFDPPGALGTGLCLSHAILDKTAWMRKLGVDYDYPCQGIPTTIHADNAKEFRGKTLKFACEQYGAGLQFRKLKKPRYGAHIERLMGTLMAEIHSLPGTTFSNSKMRADYDSEANASLTLREFEVWFANLVVGAYHHRPHSGIDGEPPIVKYSKAIVGDNGLPMGEINIVTDEEKLYYDFLPIAMLTVQPYGAQLDLIQYTADVLRRWVGATEHGKPSQKRKFIFRRDPRDISALFFFDPDSKRYYRIPYRNLANPHISLWELRAIRAHLKAMGKLKVDEDAVFGAYNEMRRIENQAVATTKHTRRSNAQKSAIRRRESPQPKFGQPVPGRPQEIAGSHGPRVAESARPGPEIGKQASSSQSSASNDRPPDDLGAFDEIERY